MATPTTPQQPEQHPLTLKVMRLMKPTLAFTASGSCHYPFATLPGDLATGAHNVPSLCESGVDGPSRYLSLPANFGDIHLGETFGCYVSVYNHSNNEVVSEVSLKSEIQAQTQRFSILDTSHQEDSKPFGPKARKDFILKHTVNEACFHILHCVCSYTTANGTKKSFRKFFKFPVTDPLGIESTIISVHDGYIIKAAVTNNSKKALYIENLNFVVAHEQLTCVDLSPQRHHKEQPTNLEKMTYLKVSETSQYLFRIQFRNLTDPTVKDITTLGKFIAAWRGPFGEKGFRETKEITHSIPYKHSLSLVIENIPPRVTLEQPFKLTLRLINRTSKEFWPHIITHSPTSSLSRHGDVMVIGKSSEVLDQIPPGGNCSAELTFLPLRAGYVNIAGITVVDQNTRNTYQFTELHQIFVEKAEEGDLFIGEEGTDDIGATVEISLAVDENETK